MGNLDKSTIAMIFFLGLVALFLILIIATIAVIVSGSKRKNEEYDEDDADGIEVDNLDDEYANGQYMDENNPDESYNENYQDGDIFQDAEADLGDMADSAFRDDYDASQDSAFSDDYDASQDSAFSDDYDASQDSAFSDNYDASQDSAFSDEFGDMSDSAFTDDDDPYHIDEPTNEIEMDVVKEASREKNIDDLQEAIQVMGEEITVPLASDADEATVPLVLDDEELEIPMDEGEELTTPLAEVEETTTPLDLNAGINYDAIKASVAEAAEIADAVKDDMAAEQTTIGAMFGVSEEVSRFGIGRKKRERSMVASDEEFYWFNRDDVESRPSHRKPELYYHYFSVPDDCIEDLLVEMYDCAAVRTEEIRYIAYGIEPKSYSMKQIMSAGFDINQGKKKNPSTQDLVKIYEKWCVYVDNLLDKIEIHADEYTIQAIRQKLCEYGRNDVDVLLEGK